MLNVIAQSFPHKLSSRCKPGPRTISQMLGIYRFTSFFKQVTPIGIGLFDQFKLRSPPPFLQLFFTPDCQFNMIEMLKPNENLYTVFLRESGNGAMSVLCNAIAQISCHANVKGAVSSVRQNINSRLNFIAQHHPPIVVIPAQAGTQGKLHFGAVL
jgi:hypothetical protein